MNVDGVLTAGRAAANSRMRDTVRLYTQDPDVFDRTSGTTVPGEKHPFYEGMARVKPVAQASGEDVQASDREVRLLEYQVSLPADTQLPNGFRVLPGMQAEVLASQDLRMVGLVLWITGAQFGDQATAWRLTVEDRS
ncbi:DUF6093 family protein [Streptomyces sp. NBC_00847]|uniref:DUF6093 family protein n=1 Tax=Streptomyces sp. NBC_00847 TaxID=2975850 RepID=UPI00225DF811|nr:DUF6093 family protein [Streptomyces sp. NBC_00847]MCX4886044.1 DUF6093 family protein [Streptomyces sp. NBC_00847]